MNASDLPSWIQAFSALASVLVAIAIWCTTRRQINLLAEQKGIMDRQANISSLQTDIMTKQKEIARLEWMASHRPKLKVYAVQMFDGPNGPRPSTMSPDEGPIWVKFSLINSGSCKAGIVAGSVNLEWRYNVDRPYPPSAHENDVIPKISLDLGESRLVQVQTDDLGQAHLCSHETNKTLYLSGWVKYLDAADRPRTTYFCRLYDRNVERFKLTGEADCEATF